MKSIIVFGALVVANLNAFAAEYISNGDFSSGTIGLAPTNWEVTNSQSSPNYEVALVSHPTKGNVVKLQHIGDTGAGTTELVYIPKLAITERRRYVFSMVYQGDYIGDVRMVVGADWTYIANLEGDRNHANTTSWKTLKFEYEPPNPESAGLTRFRIALATTTQNLLIDDISCIDATDIPYTFAAESTAHTFVNEREAEILSTLTEWEADLTELPLEGKPYYRLQAMANLVDGFNDLMLLDHASGELWYENRAVQMALELNLMLGEGSTIRDLSVSGDPIQQAFKYMADAPITVSGRRLKTQFTDYEDSITPVRDAFLTGFAVVEVDDLDWLNRDSGIGINAVSVSPKKLVTLNPDNSVDVIEGAWSLSAGDVLDKCHEKGLKAMLVLGSAMPDNVTKIAGDGSYNYDLGSVAVVNCYTVFKQEVEAQLDSYVTGSTTVKYGDVVQSIVIANEPSHRSPKNKSPTMAAAWTNYLIDYPYATYKAETGVTAADPATVSFRSYANANPTTSANFVKNRIFIDFGQKYFTTWLSDLRDFFSNLGYQTSVKQIIDTSTNRLRLFHGIDLPGVLAFNDFSGNDSTYYETPQEYLQAPGDVAVDFLPTILYYDVQKSLKVAPIINSEYHVIRNGFNGLLSPNHTYRALMHGALHGGSIQTVWQTKRWLFGKPDVVKGLYLSRPYQSWGIAKAQFDLNRVADTVYGFIEDSPAIGLIYSATSYAKDPIVYRELLERAYVAMSASGFNVGFLTEEQLSINSIPGNFSVIVGAGVTNIASSALGHLADWNSVTGHETIVFGDDVFDYDALNIPSTVVLSPAAYEIAHDVGTASAIATFRAALVSAGVALPFSYQIDYGSGYVFPSDIHVEVRYVEIAGQKYASVVNLTHVEQNIAFSGSPSPSSILDILTGQEIVGNAVTVPPAGVLILKFLMPIVSNETYVPWQVELVLKEPRYARSDALLRFPSEIGKLYTVETSTTLVPAEWSPISEIVATEAMVSVTASIGSEERRFWRVRDWGRAN